MILNPLHVIAAGDRRRSDLSERLPSNGCAQTIDPKLPSIASDSANQDDPLLLQCNQVPPGSSSSSTKTRPQATTTINAIPVLSSQLMIIYITTILFISSNLACAHSNINSVWLSKDASFNSTQKPASSQTQPKESRANRATLMQMANKLMQRTGDSWVTSAYPSASSSQSAPLSLQASSSSMQPVITTPDNDENVSNFESSFGDRARSPYNTSTSGGYGGTFSNAASSLNHLWSINQTNAQVQFDEEHTTNTGANNTPPDTTTTTSVGPFGIRSMSNRRQVNETSTQAPQHDAPAVGDADLPIREADSPDKQSSSSSSNSIKSSQPQQQMNYLVGNLDSNNQPELTQMQTPTLNTNSNNAENNRSSTPIYYYMPTDANKWNPANGTSAADDFYGARLNTNQPVDLPVRRKLHNSGTQYNYQDLERILKSNVAATYAQQPLHNMPDLMGYDGVSGHIIDDYRGGYHPLAARPQEPINREQQQQHRRGAANAGGGYVTLRNYPSVHNSRRRHHYYYYGGAGDQLNFGGGATPQNLGVSGSGAPHWKFVAPQHYGFLPQASELTASQPRTTPLPAPQTPYGSTASSSSSSSSTTTTTTAAPTTTNIPNLAMYTTHRASHSPVPLQLSTRDYRRFIASASPFTNTQRLQPHLVRAPPTKRPLRFELVAAGDNTRRDSGGVASGAGGDAVWRRRPQVQRPRQEHPAAFVAIGQRPSFLAGYAPTGNGRIQHSAGTTGSGGSRASGKPKKSLLGTLGSKLNSWVDREQKIEDKFYGTGSQHRRRTKLPSYWNAAANTIYYIDAPQAALASVMEPALVSHPASYLAAPSSHLTYAAAPPIRLATAEQAHRLLRAASPYSPHYHYPASLYGTGSTAYLSAANPAPSLAAAIQQPTVAPAPSSLDKFYSSGDLYGARLRPSSHKFAPDSHLSQSSHHLSQYAATSGGGNLLHHSSADSFGGQQQQANFIPVVAVSVTKTSPAPRPMQLLDSVGLDHQSQADLNSELMDYLEMKTGDNPAGGGHYSSTRNSQRNRLHSRGAPASHGNNSDINMVRAQLDDYGNLASGSVSRDTSHTFQRHHSLQPPHQLQQPMTPGKPAGSHSSGEHTTTVKSAIFGYLPHEANKPLMQAINMLPPAPGGNHKVSAYANDYQLSELHPVHSYHHFPSQDHLLALDEPPSLALQLQANNFAQNDIAHPFHTMPTADTKSSYTGNGALHSLLSQQQQISPARSTHHQPIDVYPTSQHQFHGFQLVQPAESAHYVSSHHAALNPLLTDSAGQQQPTILTAAATELNPLLPAAVMFAASPAYAVHPQTATATGSEDEPQSLDDDPSGSPLNKGKKRSGDFFASAGQLLLSALPLLLAPTLGLMFASSPLPVARYHAPNTFSGGSSSMHSSIPGEYLNSLSGHVSNASPVPQLFTPSPPGYNLTSTTGRPAKLAGTRIATSGSSPAAAVSPSGGVRQNRTTPTPQKLTLTLTTLGPPVFANETEVVPDDTSSNKVQTIDHHHHHHHVGNTILLLADEPPDPERTLDIGNGTDYKSNQTEGGYEGVDYDAQFANLKKYGPRPKLQVAQPPPEVNASSLISLGDTRIPADKKDRLHQYINEPTADIRHPHQTAGNRATRPQPEDDTGTKLYPVSTWPPLRRKTVSLVTSNGNKTLLDASEKYPTIDYYTTSQQAATSGPPNKQSNNYTTTFDDSVDEPELVAYSGGNSSDAGSGGQREVSFKRAPAPVDDDSGSNKSNGGKNDALEFVFSDGLSTVSLTREPYASRLAKKANSTSISGSKTPATRSKRQVNLREAPPTLNDLANTETTSFVRINGRPVRVVRRAVRLQQQQQRQLRELPANATNTENIMSQQLQHNGTNLAESASSLDVATPISRSDIDEEGGELPGEAGSLGASSGVEPLRIDGSKSKSAHIVATMIARLDDAEEDARHQHQAASSDIGSGYYQQPSDSRERDNATSAEMAELKRMLLRKKALVARLDANSNSSKFRHRQPERFGGSAGSRPDEERRQMTAEDSPAEEVTRFSAGGRGRIPPVEAAPVIKIKLYTNNHTAGSRSARPPLSRGQVSSTGALELSDETKKALANFGNLMIKDTTSAAHEQHLAGGNNADMEPYQQQQHRFADAATTSRHIDIPHQRRHPALRNSNHLWEDERGSGKGPQDSYSSSQDGSGVMATERSVSTSPSFAHDAFRSPIGAEHDSSEGYAARDDRGGGTYLRKPTATGSSRYNRTMYPRRPSSSSRDEGDYYYAPHYNAPDDVGMRPPPRSAHPASPHHHMMMRDRVNLFDGGDSYAGSVGSSDDRSASEDYHNGHHGGYARSRPMGSAATADVSNSSEKDQYGIYQPPEVADPGRQPNLGRQAGANYSHNEPPRRLEPSHTSGAHWPQQGGASQANRRDSSLHPLAGFGGGSHDMRTYLPDPLQSAYATSAPPLSDIQSYVAYNATTYAPHIYHHHKPNYQQQPQQQYNHQQDDNYPGPAPVPNAYNRPDYYSPASSSSLGQHNFAASSYSYPPPAEMASHHNQQKYHHDTFRYPASSDNYGYTTPNRQYPPPQQQHRNSYQPLINGPPHASQHPSTHNHYHPSASVMSQHAGGPHPLVMSSSQERDSRYVNDYLKRVQFSDSDRDKLMASYLTCDGLLNDNDHCLERLSCEFSDPQNIEKANKLDRAVSSILLGHILINTYIPNQFKLRLKSASLFGYTQSGKCSRFVCHKLSRPHNSGVSA